MSRPIARLVPALAVIVLAPAASGAQQPSADSAAPPALAAALAPVPSDARLRVAAQGQRHVVRRDAVQAGGVALGAAALGLSAVDSVWVQRGTLAPHFGWAAAAACGTLLGSLGRFLGSDPDSGGDGGMSAIGMGVLFGMFGAGLCGVPAAGIGSYFPRWRLLWGRPQP